jgi:preprotein translocase subunit SecE
VFVCRGNGFHAFSTLLDPTPPSTTTEDSAARPGAAGLAGTSSPAEEGPAEAEAESGFLGETLAELRKVVWPSRQQLFSESVAVVLMVGLSAAAIAAVDRLFGWVAAQVFR